MTLLEVIKTLNGKDRCLDFIEKLRWPDGVICPRCEGVKVHRLRARKKFECSNCHYQFSPTAGKAMSKTYLPLPKWMLAIYLYCAAEGQITPGELVKILEVPYKTAWHMLKKIRTESTNFDFGILAGMIAPERHPGEGGQS